MDDKKSLNQKKPDGHRGRLRQKFLDFGIEKLTDDEIVELLLTLATPRKDCKLIARDALKRFGSLAGVLDASVDDLKKVDGIGPTNAFGVRLIQSIARKFLREKIIREDYLNSFSDVLDYFSHTLRREKKESFHILFLNSQNAILHEERLSTGSPTHVTFFPRQIIEKALTHGATSLVLAHNHPGGDAQPSKHDIYITRQLYFAARLTELWIREHLIFSNNGFYSFLNEGLIDQFEKEYEKFHKNMRK
jgi:DNA repair protein RadC